MIKTKKELEKEIKDLKKKMAKLEEELLISKASIELLKSLIKKPQATIPNYNIWPSRSSHSDRRIC